MPEKDIQMLLAAAATNEQVGKYLLLQLPGSAEVEANTAFPDSGMQLSQEDIKLLKKIKADNLPEFANKLHKLIG